MLPRPRLMKPTPEQLAHLLARCALGDRHSFEQLYHATSAQLFGLILRIVKQRDKANEILQEVYVKIWQRAGDYSVSKAAPLTWMGTVARNQAIDTLRRGNQQPATVDEPIETFSSLAEPGLGPEEQTHEAHRNAALHHCLNQLQGQQKQALLLAYFQGLTHEELSVKLDSPIGTVKSWVRRGLQRLKQCLES